MDDTVSRAICAVPLEDAHVEAWFELICRTHANLVDADQLDWGHFCSRMAEGAMAAGVSAALVDQFVEHMVANDLVPLETVGHLAEMPTELAYHYRESAVPAAAAGTDPAATYDEPAWQTFLQAHGVRWDGAESSWGQFRAWFLYEAEQQQLTVPAGGFIAYAESQQDKTEVFAMYRIPLTAPDRAEHDQRTPVDASAFPETKHGDSGQWVQYLDAMLTHSGF